MAFIDRTGQRFTRLIVLRVSKKTAIGTLWLCRCDCGKETVVSSSQIGRKQNPVRSCGCLRLERANAANTTHGHTASGRRSLEYSSWTHMLQRCNNPKNVRFSSYGGRGITVCNEWLSFERFLADIGPRPTKRHSLDRINNDLPYSQSNCRWATSAEQARNKRTTVRVMLNCVPTCLQQASHALGLPFSTVSMRVRRGWSINEALGLSVKTSLDPF